MREKIDQSMQKLENASPLEAAAILRDMEMYDAKSAQQVIDEVYEEFATGRDKENSIIKPIFLSIADGIIQGTSFGRVAARKGLTASRVVTECEDFSYERDNEISDVDGYTEYVNASEFVGKFAGGPPTIDGMKKKDAEVVAAGYRDNFLRNPQDKGEYNREKLQNQQKMNGYRQKMMSEAGKNKNMSDEYTGKTNITGTRAQHDKRHGEASRKYQAETDHIVPLAKIHVQFRDNYGLSKDDVRRIANADTNFALTSGTLNAGKNDKTNTQYVQEQGDKLDLETQRRMLEKEKEAQAAINKDANSTIVQNLMGNGHTDRDEKKEAVAAREKKLGKKLSELSKEDRDKELKGIDKSLAKKKQQNILGKTFENATTQAKDYAVGNILLFVVKPLYYEVKDIAQNGLKDGVGANSVADALSIRFKRVKNYVMKHAVSFLGDSMIEFIKGIVSSFIEGIISLFVGIFRQVAKLLKEGITLFIRASKIIFGEQGKQMTSNQKGDAIIKIVGGSVIAIAGVGIEFLLSKIVILKPWEVILSTIFSGIASAAFMILLDKVDLFSVKSEKRRERIQEIFAARIADIDYAVETCNTQAVEILKKQRQGFNDIKRAIDVGFEENDIDSITDGLYNMADFMHVDLPYSNTPEFVRYYDSRPKIIL